MKVETVIEMIGDRTFKVLSYANDPDGTKRFLRWRRAAIAGLFVILWFPPLLWTVLVVRWDVERTRELAQTTALAEFSRHEATCWRSAALRIGGITRNSCR
jgi:hypothetical protein